MAIMRKSIIFRLLWPAGLLVFIGYAGPFHWLTIVAVATALLALGLTFFTGRPAGRRAGQSAEKALWPLASGLLCPLLKLFYWDQFDLKRRVLLLLALALAFAWLRLARHLRVPEKLIGFFNRRSLIHRLLLIFLVSEICFLSASLLITVRGVKLVGDEPHYLAIAQSLAQDRDLNVFNQYYRGRYREFLDADRLPVHGTFGRGYKRIYSYHLPGLSLTLAPFFFITIKPPLLYFLIRAYLGLYGALLAVLVYLFAVKLWPENNRPLFVYLAFTFTAPVFFFSFHAFPEVQALLLVSAALYLLLFPGRHPHRSTLLAGLLLGMSVCWGIKYSLFIILYCLGFLVYFLKSRSWRKALLLLIFPLIFQALFFGYLYHAYGNFSPSSVYRGILNEQQQKEYLEEVFSKIPLKLRLETLLDYFFDQRDGLLLYNPFYFFAFPGLILALKKIKKYSWHLLLSLPAAVFIFNHAFSTIRAGQCPQGRYLTPVISVLMLLTMIYYQETGNQIFKKLFRYLPVYSILVVIFQVFYPATLYQSTTHDSLYRPGLLFQHWSNLQINLPGLLPSFIKTDNSRWLANPLFLAGFVLLTVFALLKVKAGNKRLLWPLACLILLGMAILFPRPALFNPSLVEPSGSLSYFLFTGSDLPDQPSDGRLALKNGWRHFIIGSREPLTRLIITIDNSSGRDRPQVVTRVFDRPVAALNLMPKESRRLEINPGKFARRKSLFLYQFNIRSSQLGNREPGLTITIGIPPGQG